MQFPEGDFDENDDDDDDIDDDNFDDNDDDNVLIREQFPIVFLAGPVLQGGATTRC